MKPNEAEIDDQTSKQAGMTLKNCASYFYRIMVLAGICSTFVTLFLLGNYLKTSVAPVITNVHEIIRKADVVFNLLYEYLCVRTQLVSVDDCITLKKALAS